MRAPPIRDAARGGASTGPNGARHRADRGAGTGAGEPTFDLHRAMDFVVGQVRDQAHAHPLRTLGVAAGVGYVLGRGVPSIVVRLGMVAMARMATDSLLSGTFGATLGPGDDERPADDDGAVTVVDDVPDDATDATATSRARGRGRQPARGEGVRTSTDD
jgi:hypothetical protein